MQAFKGGWNRVKLYFMLGLPGETYDDIEGIAKLSNEIAALYYTIPKDERPGARVDVVSSTSFLRSEAIYSVSVGASEYDGAV